jgi:hypothetical protein
MLHRYLLTTALWFPTKHFVLVEHFAIKYWSTTLRHFPSWKSDKFEILLDSCYEVECHSFKITYHFLLYFRRRRDKNVMKAGLIIPWEQVKIWKRISCVSFIFIGLLNEEICIWWWNSAGLSAICSTKHTSNVIAKAQNFMYLKYWVIMSS